MNKITFKQFDQKHSKKPETKKNKDPTPYESVFDYVPTPPSSRGFNLKWDDVTYVPIDHTRYEHMYQAEYEHMYQAELRLRELEQQYQQISRRQNEHSSF